jgi:hypothetical protein
MVWKCPQCNKELKENDATRGNCPYCFQTFDRPEEFQEENTVPVEKPAGKFWATIKYNNNSALFWLSLTALCLLLISLYLEIKPASKTYHPALFQAKTEKKATSQTEPSQPESGPAKSLRIQEKEISRTILLEYGRKACQKINEALERERLLQQKDESKLGSLFGSPIGLAHTQLQSVYAEYGRAYLLLLDANKDSDEFKIVSNDIVAGNTDFAKGKLVVQLITPSSLSAENTELFNAVHSEPYQFLVSCVRSGNEWKVKEWIMTGTEWNFRPLPH